MPPRRKPTSTTQKKAAQKAKRAIKRGDLPPEPKKPAKNRHRGPPVSEAVRASRKLQSAFVTLDADFLEQTRVLAATLPLTRPIPASTCVFPTTNFDEDYTLTCPRRPKWRFDMSKTEVERNEEGLFRKVFVFHFPEYCARIVSSGLLKQIKLLKNGKSRCQKAFMRLYFHPVKTLLPAKMPLRRRCRDPQHTLSGTWKSGGNCKSVSVCLRPSNENTGGVLQRSPR